MIKDIFIMSDVYVINIKEKKNSEKLINFISALTSSTQSHLK